MADPPLSRRAMLAGLAAAGVGASAGCLGAPAGANGETPTSTPTPTPPDAPTTPGEFDEARYRDIYQNTIDSVAMVRTYGTGGPLGQGSGFVVRDGHLITNEHVVAGATGVELQFRDNVWTEGEVVGTDRFSDLAVIEADRLPSTATPLRPAERRATVGQEVLALGNPFGLEESVSQGIVSGRNRSLPTGTGFRIPATIQTDASVNPGNSGGPLVAMNGRYLGVITARAGQDIGFAVSWRLAERVGPSLIETGSFAHSFMGVRLLQVDPAVAEANDLDEVTGVIVTDVLRDGPADDVLRGSADETVIRGVRVPVGGDVIVALDGRPVATQEALSTYLALHTDPGDVLSVTVIRDGDRETVSFELEERPT